MLVRELGSGGMGRVFEARHPSRSRPEALKVLRAGFGGDASAHRRFDREVRAISALSAHDHVVTLYDSGVVRGEMYYTMALLPGPGLDEVIERVRATGETRPGTQALAVLDAAGMAPLATAAPDAPTAYARRVAAAFVGVADALATLHDQGALHRDVKPSNLILDDKHRIQLADFGLTRVDGQTITEPNQFLGTPGYMSPEQVLEQGEGTQDGRADIYSLGATLFELLTLERPHDGGNMADTVALILKRHARTVRSLHPGMPPDIDTIVGRCLERDPADRYPDAHALRDDLRRFAHGDPVDAKPVSRWTRAARTVRRLALPIVAVLLIAAGGLWWYARQPGRVTVRSVPTANVFVQDALVGVTPLMDHELPAGDYRLRVEREAYAPYETSIRVSGRSTHNVVLMLQALDPASPEARATAARAFGLTRSGENVSISRSSRGPLAVVAPLGALRSVPDAVEVWASRPAWGKMTLSAQPDAEVARLVVHTWDLEADREETFPIPDDVRATLRPEVSYEIRLVPEFGSPVVASFRLLSAEQRAEIAQWLEAAKQRFQPGDRSYDFVAAEFLLRRHAYADALRFLEPLPEVLGERREIARLALEIMDRAEMGMTPARRAWSMRFLNWKE